jgi:hypothetical protein
VQDHCLKCHLPNGNIFYLSAIPGFIILVGLYVAVHCRTHPRLASIGEASSIVAGKNAALMGSPRLDDASASDVAVSKLDDRHDQVQVQVRQ